MSKQFEVRDTRNGEWHWVNNAVIACPHITHSDKSVYAALTTFSGCKEIRPNFKTISERCNVSERAAKTSIKRLQDVGYLKIENFGRKGLTNIYYLLKASQGCEKCKSCTTDKKGNSRQEEVQTTAGSSANLAPQVYNTNYINNNIINTVAKATQPYGRDDINQVFFYLKEKIGGSPDGSIAENRKFAKLLLDRFKKDYVDKNPIEQIKQLINFGLEDKFHGRNITSFKYLYYNAQKIIKSVNDNSKRVLIL